MWGFLTPIPTEINRDFYGMGNKRGGRDVDGEGYLVPWISLSMTSLTDVIIGI